MPLRVVALTGAGISAESGVPLIAGAVFRRLSEVRVGDRVEIYGRDRRAVHVVIERHILPERGQPLAVRRANARWIGTTAEPRLTMVRCWPPWSNSHRLIVVARPAEAMGTASPVGGCGPLNSWTGRRGRWSKMIANVRSGGGSRDGAQDPGPDRQAGAGRA